MHFGRFIVITPTFPPTVGAAACWRRTHHRPQLRRHLPQVTGLILTTPVQILPFLMLCSEGFLNPATMARSIYTAVAYAHHRCRVPVENVLLYTQVARLLCRAFLPLLMQSRALTLTHSLWAVWLQCLPSPCSIRCKLFHPGSACLP
jgi:hypothetical protein